jgi:hypothetical protein
MLLAGLTLLALGGWLCWLWWPAVQTVLLACIAVAAVLFGLLLVVFGISEIAGATKREPKV